MSALTTPHPLKKRGPVSRGYSNTHILLPPELLEWAKVQPEGLSGLVRALLADELARRARIETWLRQQLRDDPERQV
jgi:hypothetical protein